MSRLKYFSHPDMLVADATQEAVPRQGTQPTRVVATLATGQQRVRVVVPNPGATQVRRTNARTNYLGEARVVIITDTMVGATEGRRREIFPSRKFSNLR